MCQATVSIDLAKIHYMFVFFFLFGPGWFTERQFEPWPPAESSLWKLDKSYKYLIRSKSKAIYCYSQQRSKQNTENPLKQQKSKRGTPQIGSPKHRVCCDWSGNVFSALNGSEMVTQLGDCCYSEFLNDGVWVMLSQLKCHRGKQHLTVWAVEDRLPKLKHQGFKSPLQI